MMLQQLNAQDDGYATYDMDGILQGKRACKMALQKELGLPVNADAPMLGFIGRLDYQKVCGGGGLWGSASMCGACNKKWINDACRAVVLSTHNKF